MSTTPALKAELRDETGSAASGRTRRSGRTPAILYGHGQSNVNLALDTHELELALKGASQLFNLELPSGTESALVKEVQYDTFGQRVLHVDFARIDLTEEVHVEVHVEYKGTPKGADEGGDALVLHALVPVVCRADAIPDQLEVSVKNLEIGQQIHASELPYPPGVKLDEHEMEPEEAVYAVAAPRVEEEPETEEAEEVGETLGEEGEEGDESEGEDASEEDEDKPEGEG